MACSCLSISPQPFRLGHREAAPTVYDTETHVCCDGHISPRKSGTNQVKHLRFIFRKALKKGKISWFQNFYRGFRITNHVRLGYSVGRESGMEKTFLKRLLCTPASLIFLNIEMILIEKFQMLFLYYEWNRWLISLRTDWQELITVKSEIQTEDGAPPRSFHTVTVLRVKRTQFSTPTSFASSNSRCKRIIKGYLGKTVWPLPILCCKKKLCQ